MIAAKDQVLEVWGDFACFTRPEMKVERFSYPLPTPSAARGIFDAIYCKPSRDGLSSEFRWQVTKIELLSQPKYISLRRNEVKDKASIPMGWITGQSQPEPILADVTSGTEKGRTQRQTMALKDVRYRLHAKVCPFPGFEDRIQAIEAQFRRRASNGKCVHQPYFGCREFPAFFELVEVGEPPTDTVPLDIDVGLMLYDVFDLSGPGTSTSPVKISLFRAEVKNGVLDIPPYESDAVIKAQGGEACD